MPDEATIQDVAKKLERWAASLPEDERAAVEQWMALGTGAPFTPGRRWWFQASTDSDRLSATEAE